MKNPGCFKPGKLNPRWNNNRTINGKGYVLIYLPDHHRADSKGYVYEHILVAEKMMGRLLEPKETVHHKDEIRCHNAPKNIQVFKTKGEHTAYHRKLQRERRALESAMVRMAEGG